MRRVVFGGSLGSGAPRLRAHSDYANVQILSGFKRVSMLTCDAGDDADI